MSCSVLVTGAFGKVGGHTVQHLLESGHRVIAVDLRSPKTELVAAGFGEAVEVVWGNICDPALWAEQLPKVDAVVHLAAIIPPVVERNPKLAEAVNLTATAELVRKMEASPKPKRLVFASSMVVGGHEQHRRVPPLRVDEPPCPTDLYGRTKAECERLIQASSLDWSILRLSVVCATEVSLKEADSTQAMFDGSANGRIEVVHPDDAGVAFANAVTCDGAIGKILYVGGGDCCRSLTLDFYNGMFGALGLGRLNADTLRPGPPHFYGDWLDTAESQRLLHFQRHSLADIYQELRGNVGGKRWLLKCLSPLVMWLIERRSPYRT